MHHIHSTDGLVLGSKPYREAGKIIHIFTRELGLVTAIAEGVRLERSKLRYSVQDYSFARFSLVHGKEFWRIVGATECEEGNISNKTKLLIFAPVALLLRRLLHGEQANESIFICLENCADYIDQFGLKDDEEVKTMESLTVIRILRDLGYVGRDASLSADIEGNQVTKNQIEGLKSKRTEMNKKINNALRESHL